jgi:GDP/UDP-N,N'-diacetylbacillosamine 2-epimerase (hydrolysing)
VRELLGETKNIQTVGALSLDGISKFKPLEKEIFYAKFGIPQNDFALITFHPETISPELNHAHALEMRKSLEYLKGTLHLVITMPNADTMGSIFRKEIGKLKKDFPDKVLCIENFGKDNYFSAMYYSKFLIGNTSSGILEAASFGKYVINVGDRQKGRLQSENTYNVTFKSESIIDVVNHVLDLGEYEGENVYHQIDSAQKIIEVLKNQHAGI